MRRRPIATRVSALLLMGAATFAAGGCVGSAPTEPTLPTVDFRPKLVLDVDDGAIEVIAGDRRDDAVRLDPTSVPAGTVAEVRIRGTRDHRLQGNAGKVFDTGVLRPGERTTIVLDSTAAEDLVIDVTDRQDPGARTRIVVRPRAAS